LTTPSWGERNARDRGSVVADTLQALRRDEVARLVLRENAGLVTLIEVDDPQRLPGHRHAGRFAPSSMNGTRVARASDKHARYSTMIDIKLSYN
jgi:hypothetical protein